MPPKIKSNGLIAAAIGGTAALSFMLGEGDLDYKDIEIKSQEIRYEDCHGSDGTDPSKITSALVIVDANGNTHEIFVPKSDVREIEEKPTEPVIVDP